MEAYAIKHLYLIKPGRISRKSLLNYIPETISKIYRKMILNLFIRHNSKQLQACRIHDLHTPTTTNHAEPSIITIDILFAEVRDV